MDRGEMDREEGERHAAVIERHGPILARERELGLVYMWRTTAAQCACGS